MTSEMAFECLLVSHDPFVYSTIGRVLRNFSITVDQCLSASKAQGVIPQSTHDLVVIDWEGDASSDLLSAIWSLPRKRRPTLVAISSDGRSIPGTHITLQKPVTIQSGTESVKAAYSRMLLDYRLNTRYAVMTPATAHDQHGRNVVVTITDIGDGGVGITCRAPLAVGDVLSFNLCLPETHVPLSIRARVDWTRDYGAAGCEFLEMPPHHRDFLRDWLKSKIRIKQPSVSFDE
jgi:hypothetical protein